MLAGRILTVFYGFLKTKSNNHDIFNYLIIID